MSDLPSKITGAAGDEESPGVVIVDADCRVLDVDEVAAEVLGDGAEAFVGSAATERFRGLVKENEGLSTIASQRIRRSCTLLRTNGDEIPVDVGIRRFLGGGVQRFALEFAVREHTKPRLNDSFFAAVFDSVDAIAVITDARGVIVYVNERWTRFQRENGGDIATCGIGNDYFSVCSTAQRRDVGMAKAVRDGLEEVLRGARTSFQMSYACDSATEERWFQVRGNRFSYRDQVYVVILHERVDEFKRVELELRTKQAHLEDAAKLANLGYFERIMRGPRTFDWSPETALIMGVILMLRRRRSMNITNWFIRKIEAICIPELGRLTVKNANTRPNIGSYCPTVACGGFIAPRVPFLMPTVKSSDSSAFCRTSRKPDASSKNWNAKKRDSEPSLICRRTVSPSSIWTAPFKRRMFVLRKSSVLNRVPWSDVPCTRFSSPIPRR